jgi:hypothetical protein
LWIWRVWLLGFFSYAAVDEGQQTKRRKMKKRSWRQAVRNPPIRMGQNWEPVLTEDKLKVALAKKEEARLTAGELENRLKELRARLKSSTQAGCSLAE